MKIAYTDIPLIMGEYLDSAYAPKASFNQKAFAYGLQFIATYRLPYFMENYEPIMKMAGVLNEDGLIDIDLANNIAKYAIEKSGKVELWGYFMDSSDIELIYSIAKKYGKE